MHSYPEVIILLWVGPAVWCKGDLVTVFNDGSAGDVEVEVGLDGGVYSQLLAGHNKRATLAVFYECRT